MKRGNVTLSGKGPSQVVTNSKASFLYSQETALVLIFMWLEYLEMLRAEGTEWDFSCAL